MLQAYEGYLEDGRFHPIGSPISAQGRLRVIVTVLGPHNEDTQSKPASWLDEFNRLLDTSGDDKLSIENFPRANFTREQLGVRP